MLWEIVKVENGDFEGGVGVAVKASTVPVGIAEAGLLSVATGERV